MCPRLVKIIDLRGAINDRGDRREDEKHRDICPPRRRPEAAVLPAIVAGAEEGLDADDGERGALHAALRRRYRPREHRTKDEDDGGDDSARDEQHVPQLSAQRGRHRLRDQEHGGAGVAARGVGTGARVSAGGGGSEPSEGAVR